MEEDTEVGKDTMLEFKHKDKIYKFEALGIEPV